MQIKSLLVHIFWVPVLLPGSAMSHPGHGQGMSGFLHQVYDHQYYFLGLFVLAVLVSGLGIAGWIFQKVSKQ